MHRRWRSTTYSAALLTAFFLSSTVDAQDSATEAGEEAQAEIAALEKTIADARRSDRPDLEAQAHVSLARVHARRGDAAGELVAYRRAADVLRRLDDPEATANVLIETGRAYGKAGVTGRALAAFDEAVDLARRRGLTAVEATALQAQLAALEPASDPRRQVEIAKQLLELARRLDDRELEARAATQLENAQVFVDMFDDPQMAEIAGGDVEDLLGGIDAGLQSFALKELAYAFVNRGDVAVAIELVEDSLDLVRRTEDDMMEASTLEVLASYHVMVGDTAGAKDAYQKMGEVADRLDDPRPLRAHSEILLANLLLLEGDVDKAETRFRSGLETALEIDAQDMKALAYGGLGLVAIARGDLQGAIDHLRRQVELLPFPPALETLAWLYASLGETEEALRMADASLEIVGETERGFGRAGAHTTRGFVLVRAGRWAEAEASLRRSIDEYEGLWKALEDAEQLEISGRDLIVTSELLQQALIRQGKDREALEVAEQARARAYAEALARRPGRSAVEPPSPPSLAEIRALAKASGTTLIVYSVLYDPAQLLLSQRLAGAQAEHEETLLIWVVTPEGDVSMEEVDLTALGLGPSPVPLAELIATSRQIVVKSSRGTTLRPDLPVQQSVDKALAELAAVILDPVADRLPRGEDARVVFVPQGPLFLVPFAALPGPDGEPLVTRLTVSTAPSIGVLRALEGREMPGDWSADDVLVVGNPEMPEALGVAQLPQAELEAEAVARRFRAKPLVGKAATQTAVVAAMPRHRLLHFATHGVREQGENDGGRGLDLLSALVFASKTGNGLLTAGEVAGMTLTADLVVLSACDTGQGRLTGDGVVGLSRSFLTAGAGAVVVSLWTLDDRATTFLMERFYDRLEATRDEAVALRQAMLETRKEYPSPGLWAGFSSIGGLRRSGS